MKTWELVARKYYRPILYTNIETYVKGCEVCVISKAVKNKLYENLKLYQYPYIDRRFYI